MFFFVKATARAGKLWWMGLSVVMDAASRFRPLVEGRSLHEVGVVYRGAVLSLADSASISAGSK
jgi:hypothetical protein